VLVLTDKMMLCDHHKDRIRRYYDLTRSSVRFNCKKALYTLDMGRVAAQVTSLDKSLGSKPQSQDPK